MALIQQLTWRQEDASGTLVIRAGAGDFMQLQELAQELAGRDTIRTDGDITILAPQRPDVEEES